jgi:hypothetical protein
MAQPASSEQFPSPTHGLTVYIASWNRFAAGRLLSTPFLKYGIISAGERSLTVAALIRAARVSKRSADALTDFRNHALSTHHGISGSITGQRSLTVAALNFTNHRTGLI